MDKSLRVNIVRKFPLCPLSSFQFPCGRQFRLQFHGALKALVGILLEGFGSNFSQGHPGNPGLAGINKDSGYNN